MEDKAFVDALGSYITNYRKSFHPTMSAREFADKCEISRMVINDLESKKHSGNISSITLKKISKGLGFRDSFQLKETIFKAKHKNKATICPSPLQLAVNHSSQYRVPISIEDVQFHHQRKSFLVL